MCDHDAKIIANLKEIRKIMRINAIMKIRTKIAINTFRTIVALTRQASFIEPLMTEKQMNVLCVGDGLNGTHAVQVRA